MCKIVRDCSKESLIRLIYLDLENVKPYICLFKTSSVVGCCTQTVNDCCGLCGKDLKVWTC